MYRRGRSRGGAYVLKSRGVYSDAERTGWIWGVTDYYRGQGQVRPVSIADRAGASHDEHTDSIAEMKPEPKLGEEGVRRKGNCARNGDLEGVERTYGTHARPGGWVGGTRIILDFES